MFTLLYWLDWMTQASPLSLFEFFSLLLSLHIDAICPQITVVLIYLYIFVWVHIVRSIHYSHIRAHQLTWNLKTYDHLQNKQHDCARVRVCACIACAHLYDWMRAADSSTWSNQETERKRLYMVCDNGLPFNY